MSRPLVAKIVSFACALLLSGLAGSSLRAAEDDPGDGEAPAVKKSYRKAIKDGVAEYDARRFEEALGYFRKAHDIYPNARTYRGIGMASFELRDYVTAVRNLTAALEDQRKPLSPDQRKETEDLIERCRLFVAIFTLKIFPPTAQVTVDANPVELEPDGTMMLGLGVHNVEARLKGYRTRSQSVPVRGGERKELQIVLDPVASLQPKALPSTFSPTAAEPSVAESTPKRKTSTAWFVAGGAAAAAAIGAGVYWGLQFSELSSCRNPPQNQRCTDEPSLQTQWNIGAVATIVAGAAAVTFVTLGILARRNENQEAKRRQAFTCLPGPLSLSCTGSF
jgi:tetratricopeptide (TPR) repeat protein